MDTQTATCSPPIYDFEERQCRTVAPSLSTALVNFTRVAKWCPDGSCILAQHESGDFTLLDPAQEIFDVDAATVVAGDDVNASVSMPQPAPILDFVWFPHAMRKEPASYCFVASVRECPVRLLDASDGRLRASYRIVDHRERQIAPHCIAFNLASDRIYCGFDCAIEQFSLHQPGEGVRLHTTPSRKSKDGLKGIISSLAFSSSYPIYAAGSLTPSHSNVALFDETIGETPVMFVGHDDLPRAGVTQLHFNSVKPHMLYASFRKRSTICCWDLRGDVDAPLRVFDRALDAANHSQEGDDGTSGKHTAEMTNQKLRFDVDPGGHWLAVGDQNGDVSVFDLSESDSGSSYPDGVTRTRPSHKFHAHNDAIGSVGFHPTRPLLLSVSGSRHFEETLSSESDSDEDDVVDGLRRVGARISRTGSTRWARDTSMKLWSLSGTDHGLVDTE